MSRRQVSVNNMRVGAYVRAIALLLLGLMALFVSESWAQPRDGSIAGEAVGRYTELGGTVLSTHYCPPGTTDCPTALVREKDDVLYRDYIETQSNSRAKVVLTKQEKGFLGFGKKKKIITLWIAPETKTTIGRKTFDDPLALLDDGALGILLHSIKGAQPEEVTITLAQGELTVTRGVVVVWNEEEALEEIAALGQNVWAGHFLDRTQHGEGFHGTRTLMMTATDAIAATGSTVARERPEKSGKTFGVAVLLGEATIVNDYGRKVIPAGFCSTAESGKPLSEPRPLWECRAAILKTFSGETLSLFDPIPLLPPNPQQPFFVLTPSPTSSLSTIPKQMPPMGGSGQLNINVTFPP